MPAKIYRVTFTDEERQNLTDLTSKGTGNARGIKCAQMLLLADENRVGGGLEG